MREYAVGNGIIRLVTREYAVGKLAANRVFPDILGYSRVLKFSRFSERRQAKMPAHVAKRTASYRLGPPGTAWDRINFFLRGRGPRSCLRGLLSRQISSLSITLVKSLFPRLLTLALLAAQAANAQSNQQVTISFGAYPYTAPIAPRFLGLSYESSMLLPKDGKYYFDANDQALINTFHTLGIKSLRVGANAVDDPTVAVPQEKDIDQLFNFARAAGVKVIYSFRLKNGAPAESARLAAYIASHYADLLDAFAIGNEPNFYLKPYDTFFAAWKPHYDAILKAVPNAMFDGPSADGPYALHFQHDLYADGHLAMVSDHYYFLGSGRAAEKDPPASRARFLSNKIHDAYEKAWNNTGKVLAGRGIVPYRIDELNSCYNGGAKDSSDTYADALWVLDCTHWWAAHHILGMNYHTGESVGRDGTFGAANYAAFVHQPDGNGFTMRPQAYGLLVFTQGAQGQPLEVKIQTAPDFDFNAYAYTEHDGSLCVTLINKSYGDHAQSAQVKFVLPPNTSQGWQELDLIQKDDDVAAKAGMALGDSAIDPQGTWSGQWKTIKELGVEDRTVVVAPASAVIVRFARAK
jgi:hypothetical protein